MAANPKCWTKCRSCGSRDLVRRSVFDRRTLPRCKICGDLIDPSYDARSDLADGREMRKEMRMEIGKEE